MSDNDHICIYRQFFEDFAKTSEIEVSRPMRVNPYDLSVDELVGEVMQSSVNYLVERKCPRSLVVPLTKIVVEEFINEAKKEPEEVNTPLKLNRKTHDKISEVCLRFTDNEKLSSLPAPVEETYYSTHSTKHTRRRMEDRLICFPRFHSLHNIQSNSEAGYYGIFDGHNGVNAACYAVSHLHQFLAESEYYPDNPVQAFQEAFEKTDSKYDSKDENSGTAVLAVLHQPVEKKLTVAWVGDSQAMLVNEDSFVMLIDPHKPERADEARRIQKLGGWILQAQGVYRVNGGLAISRAIGDKKLKPYVSAEPEIRVVNLTGSEHFIVMGCDGLWDVVEPQQVIETVYFEVKKNQGQVDSVAKRLVDLAKENNSTDNISVIVIFLTDPAEISNRSVDVNGHRPKILHQDGAIMEANFPANDKSPFNDPGMNGIYETNGNHFRDHLQNESDDDFGPETDVDAVDDVLTSTKNLNPFAKDCWQKKTDEESDKLIELPVDIEGEIMKFAEDFTESAKPTEDKTLSQINNNEIRSDKFPLDNLNPFETTDINNISSEPFNISHNFTEDNNKYVDEIISRKEEVESQMSPKILDQTFELKNNPEEKKNFQEISEDGSFGFSCDDITSSKQTVVDATPENTNLFFNEETKSIVEESIKNYPLESETLKESAPESNREFDVQEIQNNNSKSNEINTTSNEFKELNLNATEGAVDLMEQQTQNVPLDPSEIPSVLCSVIDGAEGEKASSDFFSRKSIVGETVDEPSSDLLSPSALVLDGELKDETVAESGGEVEDSEDDEWNYIKVESGTQQAGPVNSKVDELISSPNEPSETEIPTMNSPLNPEADEFIPVSAMSNNTEYNMNVTPKKVIPDDLTDIIASSPNWNNMDNVSLPKESAFLNEIKSRPSNIFENIDSPQQENFGEKNNNLNDSLNFIPSAEVDKENESVNFIEREPHGIDLASDMTSSFIDPSTMSSDIEIPKENINFMNSQIENSLIEKQELLPNENAPKVQELTNKELSSQLPDLLSPVPAQEVSSTSPSVDILKMSSVETPSTVSEPVAVDPPQISLQDSEVKEKKPDETSQVTSPSRNEQLVKEVEILSETFCKSPKDEESNKVQAAVGVAAAALATAAIAEAATPKKDANKSTSAALSATKNKAAPTSKAFLNGTRTSSAPKKPTTLNQTTKSPAAGRTTGTTPALSAKPTAPRTSTATKTQPKSAAPVSSSVSKAPARARPLSAVSTASKASPSPRTTVTASPRKPTTTTNITATALKSTSKTPGPMSVSATLKSKPKIPSAPIEKRPTSAVNGEIKSTIKRTEVTTKKTGGSTTTTTTTTTRMSLSARSSTAPSKPMTLKTTAATTKTLTAKPKTTMSTSTTSNLLSSKASPTGRKSTIGVDKQAKEVANRLTSKTAPKPNGVAQRSAASTATRTKKSLTSTTATTTPPLSVKNHDKTESKAEKILDEKVEKISSENTALLVDNNTDINKINSLASE